MFLFSGMNRQRCMIIKIFLVVDNMLGDSLRENLNRITNIVFEVITTRNIVNNIRIFVGGRGEESPSFLKIFFVHKGCRDFRKLSVFSSRVSPKSS